MAQPNPKKPMTATDAKTLRVAVIEDNADLQNSLVIMLNSTPAIRCVGAFSSAEDFLGVLGKFETDVLLVDINLPGMSGIDLVAKVKEVRHELEVLMLTMYEDADLIFRSLQAGASGYLLKRTSPASLMEAIRDVASGGAPMSPTVARRIVGHFQPAVARCPDIATLTNREGEILGLLCKGALYKEIADQLGISLDTVRSHVRKVYEKLHVRSRAEATVKYLGL